VNLSDLSTSPFLASADYKPGTLLPIYKIARVQMADVPTPGKKDKQSKATLYFHGEAKGYVMNKNVGRKIAAAIGEDKDLETTWVGASIQLSVVADVRRPDGSHGNAFVLNAAWPASADPHKWLTACKELSPKVTEKVGAKRKDAIKTEHGTNYEAMAVAFQAVLDG